MTKNLPDYTTVEVPDDKPTEKFTHHERRAALLRRCISAGSPYAVNQSDLAADYGVDRSTICRDMKRLRESVGDSLGEDAKLTARAVFERTLLDLRNADDWKASKAAFDVVMDWQNWLAEIGEQHREPDRSELDVDVRSRHAEVGYQIVREGEDEPLPTTGTDDGSGEQVDHEALGFTSGPVGVEVTPEDESTDE
jgi:hypothetical protein